jgi:hypothetical protein
MPSPPQPKKPSDPDVLAALSEVAAKLSPSFVFGSFSQADISQQVYLFGFEGLKLYDVRRPLVNFLYAHCKNRLINFKRDNLRRADPPCRSCHAGRPCSGAERGQDCEPYREWRERNDSKASLARGAPADAPERESRAHGQGRHAELAELRRLIDLKLPARLRSAYARLKDGAPLSRAHKAEVESAVRAICEEAGWPS